MGIVLRPYQEQAVADARAAFRDHRSALLTMPTGAGKTVVAAHIFGTAAARGFQCMFLVNRVELVKQTMDTFDAAGIHYGVIAAGFTENFFPKVQIASIDTVKRRLHRIPTPQFIGWDECRSIAAAGWSKVFAAYPDAKHLGLDATPERLDGTGLGKFFTAMVHGPSYSQLVAAGALVPFTVYAPDPPALDEVHTVQGDYDKAEIEAIMDKPKLVGNVVGHYLRHAQGLRGLTFACSVKHSHHLVEEYRGAGVNAEHLDGETDAATRDRVVRAFRRGELDVLCNVNLFSAGFDVPGVQVITDVAPTQSVSMYLQRGGRGSRPIFPLGFDPGLATDEERVRAIAASSKPRCLLLDHAGNVFKHGLPDQDREWSLEGREKRRGKRKAEVEVSVTQCPECFGVYEPAPACPYCGHVRPVQSREVEQVDGELGVVTADMIAARKRMEKREVNAARTLEELQVIGAARGHHRDWARHVFEARNRAADARFAGQAEAYLFPRRA